MPGTTDQLAAVMYARQSQNNDRSIKEQLDAGHARVAAEGWQQLGRDYSDGTSASTYAGKERDDWPEVLEVIRTGKPGVLWLWESSRGDRKLSTWAALLEDCRDHGTRIYVETHERLYNMANGRDWKTLAEDGVASEDESNKTSARVLRGMLANATSGKPHGRILYGYRRTYKTNKQGRRVVDAQVLDDPPEVGEPEPDHEYSAPIVRSIFDDIEAGVPILAIVRRLNKQGARNGAHWTMRQVQQIALNRAYIGERIHDPIGRRAGLRRPSPDAVWYKADWPPLVDEAQFWAVHRIMRDPSRVTTRPGKARHLLSMIARCAKCGDVLTASARRRGGPHYGCRRSCVLINQDDLDEYVTAEVLARVARQWEQLGAADRTNAGQELAAALGEVDKIRAALDELRKLARAREITPASFAAIEPGILADLGKAEARARELRTPPKLRWLTGDGPADLAARWNAAPPAARRAAIRQLARVTVEQSTQRGHGPVYVPPAQRTRIEWITESVAPSGG
jgi:site-specific DNA recombinase